MQERSITRNSDSFIIPEGFFFELYTPASGRILSPSLNKRLQLAKMFITADANVTFKDAAGTASATVPLKAGFQPFLVSEISVVSTGSVYIIHDGIIWSQDSSVRDMTAGYSIT